MGVLDKITKMRNEGKQDEEIVSDLKKQGVSPKQINEGLNQAQIKNAVSDIQDENGYPGSNVPTPLGQQQSQQDTYTPTPMPQQQPTSRRTVEIDQQGYGQEQSSQEYYPQQGYSGGYDYNQQGGYGAYDPYSQGTPSTNTDTMVEIAEQVFSEKIEKLNAKIESSEEFKTLAQTRLEHLMERMKRVESYMDKLQAAILEKVGSYGKDLGSIKKEMSMMQDSFSKTLNPLLEIAEGKHKTPSTTSNSKTVHKKSSKKKNSKK